MLHPERYFEPENRNCVIFERDFFKKGESHFLKFWKGDQHFFCKKKRRMESRIDSERSRTPLDIFFFFFSVPQRFLHMDEKKRKKRREKNLKKNEEKKENFEKKNLKKRKNVLKNVKKEEKSTEKKGRNKTPTYAKSREKNAAAPSSFTPVSPRRLPNRFFGAFFDHFRLPKDGFRPFLIIWGAEISFGAHFGRILVDFSLQNTLKWILKISEKRFCKRLVSPVTPSQCVCHLKWTHSRSFHFGHF